MFVVDVMNVDQKIKDDKSVFEMHLNDYEKIDVDQKDKNVQLIDDYWHDESYYMMFLVEIYIDEIDLMYSTITKKIVYTSNNSII